MPRPMPEFSDRELALHCARLVDQKGGEAVRVLQLPVGAQEFSFAVLVTANSDRLTNALVEEVWHFCKRHQVPRMPVEGETGWMLIDCYDVIVHALSPEKREYYDLDTLWPLAREVQWAKEIKTLADPDKPAAAPAKRAAKAKVAEEPEEEVEAEEEAPAAKPHRRKAAQRKRAVTPSDAAAAATAVIPEAASAVTAKRRRIPAEPKPHGAKPRSAKPRSPKR